MPLPLPCPTWYGEHRVCGRPLGSSMAWANLLTTLPWGTSWQQILLIIITILRTGDLGVKKHGTCIQGAVNFLILHYPSLYSLVMSKDRPEPLPLCSRLMGCRQPGCCGKQGEGNSWAIPASAVVIQSKLYVRGNLEATLCNPRTPEIGHFENLIEYILDFKFHGPEKLLLIVTA